MDVLTYAKSSAEHPLADHISNKDLCGSLPRLSEKLKQCRLRFGGHCYRHSEEAVSRLAPQHMASMTEGNLQSPVLTP